MLNRSFKQRLSTLALLSFFILYPVFFYYHYAVAVGLIPEQIVFVFRGLYGPFAASMLSIYLLSFFWIMKVTDVHQHWITKTFIFYLMWAILCTTANLSFFPEIYTENGALKLLKDLILQAANFALGSLLVFNKNRKTVAALCAFWIGIVILVAGTFDLSYQSFHQRLIYDPQFGYRPVSSDLFSSYQGFARSFAMTSILLLAILRGHNLRILAACVSAVTLVYIGARSELLGFLFAIAILELCISVHEKKHRLRLVLAATLLLAGGVGTSIIFGFNISDMRGLDFFALASDDSWSTRMIQIGDSWQLVRTNPIFGHFAHHLDLGDHEILHTTSYRLGSC